jgi:hypothetical protein
MHGRPHGDPVQTAGATPPHRAQCAGASVGATDSKEEKTLAPNSEKNMPHLLTPRAAGAGATSAGGRLMFTWSSWPLTAGKEAEKPCV